jgi:hypothetical protein
MSYRLAADAVPAPVKAALAELYSRGSAQRPQPRVVAVVTGGGGHLPAYMLGVAGASSCLLESLVPYDQASCIQFVRRYRYV